MAQESRLLTGEEESAQDRAERQPVHRGAGIGGDVICRGVSLLRCDPTLLHREARDVAGGEDIGDPLDAAVCVDRDEALDRLRDPVDTRAAQAGECDDAVGREALVGNEAQLAVDDLERGYAGAHRDAAQVEEPAH